MIHAEELRGPGSNVFDARNVYLDDQGRLVMETALRNGRWTSAHVFRTRSLGYGTYELVLTPFQKLLDVLTVFGFFTWDDNPAYANREIDIELARWGHATAPNLNFTVQPSHLKATNAGASTSGSFRVKPLASADRIVIEQFTFTRLTGN